MTTSTFINKNYIAQNLREIDAILSQTILNVEIPFHKNLYSFPRESFHFIMSYMEGLIRDTEEVSTQRALLKMLLDNAYKNEMKSAGAGYLSIKYAAALIKELLKIDPSYFRQNDENVKREFEELQNSVVQSLFVKSMKTIETSEIKQTLLNITEGDEALAHALYEAVSLSGLEGNIKIEGSSGSDQYLVELKQGYRFPMLPYRMFFNGESWKVKDAKMLVVDGVIDAVSEIEHLLVKTAETKIPMAIVARGFREEVIATLKSNMDRGIFNIIPIRLHADLDGLNVANDIAIVTGEDLVSSLKGEMLLYKKYETIPFVDSIECIEDTLILHNRRTIRAVSDQVTSLMSKRTDNSEIHDLSELYDGRIKSLLSHSVSIRLPNHSEALLGTVKIKIDIALRTMKTLLNHGMIDTKEAVKEMNLENATVLQKAFLRATAEVCSVNKTDTLPYLSVYLACYMTGKMLTGLLGSSGMIIGAS